MTPDEPTEIRRLAEARLAERWPLAKEHDGTDEVRRMLDELEVHKIELELQNESLLLTQAALQESVVKFSDLYDSAPVGYLTVDRNGTIISANPAAVNLLVTERTLVIDRRLALFVAVSDRRLFAKLLDEGFADAARLRFELTLENGRVVDASGACSDDRLKYHLVMVDITSAKVAELALRASEQRLSGVIESAMDAIITVDDQQRIVVFNQAACEMFRCKRDDALGQTVERFIPGRFAKDHPKQMRDFVAQKSSIARHRPAVGVRADGEEFPLEASISLGEVHGQLFASVVLRDISARQSELEARELFEQRMNAAHRLETVGTLASGIAHDFNNILGTMVANIELARDNVKGDFSTTSALDDAITASERGALLVRRLLSFSRQDQHVRRLVPFVPLLKETLQILRATIPTTISFEVTGPEVLGLVDIDATQIQQVVMNLTTNATHAMADGKGRLAVSWDECVLDMGMALLIPGLKPGRYVRMRMADTGHGMLPEVVARIFEPFYSTKSFQEGTGLGLSVVHGIIQAHDGAITVNSHVGEGTVFEIYLPLVTGVTTVETKEEVVIREGNGQRLLIVDDEESLGRATKRLLERSGYVVDVEVSSLRAVERVRADPKAYDLVLTDLTMPDLDGIELAKQLHVINPSLRIVLISGNAGRVTDTQARAAGISSFLAKPYSVDELRQAVFHAL